MHIEYISLIWGNIKLVKDKACQQQKQQQPEPINNNNNNSNICFNTVYPCRPGLAYCPWLWFLQHSYLIHHPVTVPVFLIYTNSLIQISTRSLPRCLVPHICLMIRSTTPFNLASSTIDNPQVSEQYRRTGHTQHL